jgi:hypothetical protein
MPRRMKIAATLVSLAAIFLLLGRSAPASAQQGTTSDAHRSPLTPLLGNWTCTDTGSTKPYSATVKSDGTWILWRDNGEDKNILYIGWNRSMKAYEVANVYSEGVEVSTTKAADPLNATWHVRFPEQTSGPTFSVTYSGSTFSLARPFVSHSGKRVVAKLLCNKLPK